MTRIAFIGLGIMGSPMACNLVRAGHDVIGHTRTRAKSEPLVTAGGAAADTLAEAVTGAEVIITMLPDSPDVQAVILGDEGVLAHAKPGALIIDMSTIRPALPERSPGRQPPADFGCSTLRSVVGNRRRSRGRCRSWSVAKPPISKRRNRFSARLGPLSFTSDPRAPAMSRSGTRVISAISACST